MKCVDCGKEIQPSDKVIRRIVIYYCLKCGKVFANYEECDEHERKCEVK